ncbi:hypothetical protein GTW98_13635 [Streptomyces sp. SID8375]|uniref:hypothetical protein n=1 Tax=unclassified Streptomyces TaxID=2593676 RepID=UPI001319C845|nr:MULTISPECIES: hypothetical protein [unclassified Streptomyces]MYX07833.1 hypothetical protein [Streptomyces sp. SID8375]
MRRAFIGLSGPICYDYANPIREWAESQSDIPNPILENVTGTLLCYDEIWFLSREACPVDLHEVDYVKFVSDYPTLLDRARVAHQQYTDLYWDQWRSRDASHTSDDPSESRNAFSVFGPTVERIRSAVTFDLRPDSHGRAVLEGFSSGNIDSRSLLADWGIAAALDMDMDVVMNSIMAAQALTDIQPVSKIGTFEQWKIEAVEQLLRIRTVDFLGPRGAYHESIDDLRAHPRVEEFRQFMSSSDRPDKDGALLAGEVERAAERHARDSLARFLKGNGKLFTIGGMTLGGAGNLAHPGLGSLLNGALSATKWMQDRKLKKETAWSLFVLDARRQP